MTRSRSDTGYSRHSPPSPSSPRYGRSSTGNIQPVISREKSRERTSTGQSYLNPLDHERDIGRIEHGMSQNKSELLRDGQVKGYIGGGDNGEFVKVYGVNPRSSSGRVAARGGEKIVVVDADRRRYGSQ